MKILRTFIVVVQLLVFPALAGAQCAPYPIGQSAWPMLYSTIGYSVSGGNPTLTSFSSVAASAWNSVIQANSGPYNNYAYNGIVIVPNGTRVQVQLVDPIPNRWAQAISDGNGNFYVIQIGSDTLAEDPAFAQAIVTHEFGHVAGFDENPGCRGLSVMGDNQPWDFSDWPTWADYVGGAYQYPPWDPYCNPTECSPLIIDLGQNGIRLTEPEVLFDLTGRGQPQLLGWTEPGSSNGFLVLDRNGNGIIDDGREMFGNFTPMSSGHEGPPAADGFVALGWFDRVENGGNGDDAITAADSVFENLRVWVDRDHNGVDTAGELESLDALGILSISLDTHTSERIDQHGNRFRYRATVMTERNGKRSHTQVYDVFLVTAR